MKRRARLFSVIALAVGLLASSGAFAQEAAGGADAAAQDQVRLNHAASDNSIVLAPHVGALFPQVTSDLGTWPVFGLSAGYILPNNLFDFERPLELGLDLMYTQPGATGTGHEPNIGDEGADYDWQLTQRMLVLEAYALWRFLPAGRTISPYAHVGPRAYMMESEVEAQTADGDDFGTNTQSDTEFGLVFGAGADFALGPGTLYGTLEFGWNNLDQRITGDSSVGALALDMGYRLYF